MSLEEKSNQSNKKQISDNDSDFSLSEMKKGSSNRVKR